MRAQGARLSLSKPPQCAFGSKESLATTFADWRRGLSAGDSQFLPIAVCAVQSAWRAQEHHMRSQVASCGRTAEACCGGLRRLWPGQVQGHPWSLHPGEMAALSSDLQTMKVVKQAAACACLGCGQVTIATACSVLVAERWSCPWSVDNAVMCVKVQCHSLLSESYTTLDYMEHKSSSVNVRS